MREDARLKGLRLLVDGRLLVKEVNPHSGLVVAECRGDEGIYDLGWDPWKQEYRCTCQARGKCSHIWALTMVIVPRRENAAPLAIAGSTSPERLRARNGNE